MIRAGALLGLSLLAAASAPARPSEQALLDAALAGRARGADATCFPGGRVNRPSRSYDGIGILYGQGRTLYLNRFGGNCRGLREDRIVVTESMGQVCRGDRVRLFEQGSAVPVGICILGPFEPWARPKR